MPKLSNTPKLFALSPHPDGTAVIAIVAASESEAWHHLRHNMNAMWRATPADAFELGSLGVPITYAKPEYRTDSSQIDLPLDQEVSHGQPNSPRTAISMASLTGRDGDSLPTDTGI
jgi:hypothetical protein